MLQIPYAKLYRSCFDEQKQERAKITTVETGLSDFHKMVVTVLKTTFPKQGPTVMNYGIYKSMMRMFSKVIC